MKLTVNGSSLHGCVSAIASKSSAHRHLICAALSDGLTKIRCENRSDDISATVRCLRSLGAQISYSEKSFFAAGGDALPRHPVLDAGDSASTLRFLLPVASALGADATFIRHGRLPVRPLSPLTDEMRRHGVFVSNEKEEPLKICGRLTSGEYVINGEVSSQFISGLIFALPLLNGDSTLKISGKMSSLPYVMMTLDTVRRYGIKTENTENGFFIPGNQKYVSPAESCVEGDWSSGAFWLAADFLGGNVSVTGLDENSVQGDKRIVSELQKLSRSGKVMIDAEDIPDLVPPLAVCAAIRDGITVIYNAARLREKESNRLTQLVNLINSVGGTASETEDGLKIKGTKNLHPAAVSSGGDHRIAMAAAVLSVAVGNITVDGAEAVSKSYPAFWEDFKRLGGGVTFEI